MFFLGNPAAKAAKPLQIGLFTSQRLLGLRSEPMQLCWCLHPLWWTTGSLVRWLPFWLLLAFALVLCRLKDLRYLSMLGEEYTTVLFSRLLACSLGFDIVAIVRPCDALRHSELFSHVPAQEKSFQSSLA